MRRSETSTYPCSDPLPCGKSLTRIAGTALLAWTVLACDENSPATNGTPATTVTSVLPAPTTAAAPQTSMLESDQLSKALDALLAPLEKPVRILSIIALPSQVVLQVQNAASPADVTQYSYKNGQVSGPEQVKLLGKGSLKDNLFRLRAADPRVAEEVLEKVRAQHNHPIKKLVMIRNLPKSMDIQFRVYLQTGDGELILAADKRGRVLGPIELAPTASQ